MRAFVQSKDGSQSARRSHPTAENATGRSAGGRGQRLSHEEAQRMKLDHRGLDIGSPHQPLAQEPLLDFSKASTDTGQNSHSQNAMQESVATENLSPHLEASDGEYDDENHYGSQILSELLEKEVASMNPDVRNELFGNQRFQPGLTGSGWDAQSYPSTTSGNVDDQVDECPQEQSPSGVQPDGARSPRSPRSPRDGVQSDSDQEYDSQRLHTPVQQTTAESATLSGRTPRASKRKFLDRQPPVEQQNHQEPMSHNNATVEQGEIIYPVVNEQMSMAVREAPEATFRDQQHDNITSDADRLDYEPTALYSMNFARLCEESFDQDPNVPSRSLEFQGGHGSLSDRLKTLADYPVEEQQQFFASLTMAEWKEAGAWFAQRFAQITENLQNNRQARRRMAEEFEAEVSKRYEAVIQEKGVLDATLKDMRTKGAMVLTPEKTK